MRFLLIIALGLISDFQSLAVPPDFAKVIHYIPPTNFFGGFASEPRSDPGDNPMLLNGPLVFQFRERYDYRHPSEIDFRLGLACAYLGPGKTTHFLPVTDKALRDEMEACYTNRFSNSTPPLITKIDGFTAVYFTATRPPGPVQPYFLHFCWLRIESNIVLKVTAVSSDTTIFQRETNSLQDLKIDKVSLLQMLSSTNG